MSSHHKRGSSISGDDGSSMHSNLLREMTHADVFEKYEVAEVLGNGSMGAVARVRVRRNKIGGSAFQVKSKGGLFGFGLIRIGNNHKTKKIGTIPKTGNDDHMYALKSIILDRVSPLFIKELQNEIDILRSMDHPNIVKAHEVYTGKKQIYLVLELCDGGDLYSRVPYSEHETARIVEDLCSAIRYMHEHNIVHRDLKFENVMFENASANAVIKVIDFGLSKKFMGQPGMMTDRVGTVYTMSPQVLQGVYSSKADLWATGVMTFMMLSSSKPFYHKRRRKMVDLIMRGEYSMEGPVWDKISDAAKEFVSKLLVINPKRRYSAEDALRDPWLVNRDLLPDEKPSDATLALIDNSLINYTQTSALKKLALNVIAHRSTTKDIVSLRNVFDAYDTEKDGTLSFVEFRNALEACNYPEDVLQEIFESIDVNQNGYIMYTEFLAATIETHSMIEEDRIAEAFDRLDTDDDGFISKSNLREVLGTDADEEIAAIIRSADTDNDGKISYQEFLKAFRDQTNSLANEMGAIRESKHDSEHGLVGLDAKIPGGRFDSSVASSQIEDPPPSTLRTYSGGLVYVSYGQMRQSHVKTFIIL